MPVKVQSASLAALAGIVYNGATASEFTIIVSDSNNVTLGTYVYAGGGSAYTQGSTGSDSAESVRVKITLDLGGSLGFLTSETVDIEFDLGLVVTIPLFPAFPEALDVYIDTKGTLFTDLLYTLFWDSSGIINLEAPTTSELVEGVDYEEQYESIYMSEEEDSSDVVGSLSETITASDVFIIIHDEEKKVTDRVIVSDNPDIYSPLEKTDLVTSQDEIYYPEMDYSFIDYLDYVDLTDSTEISVVVNEEGLSVTEYLRSFFIADSDPLVSFNIPDYPVTDTVLDTVPEVFEDSRFFRFGPYDFKTTSLKHLAVVELGIETDNNVYVAIEYNYNNSSVYKSTRFVKLNSKGNVKLPVTAINFNIVVLIVGTLGFKFKFLKLAHKFIDNSSTRGYKV